MLPPALRTPSPPTPGSPPGVPPQPGDSPLSAPASGSQGQFGGELTFFQRLLRGLWCRGKEGEGGAESPGTALQCFGVLGSPSLLLLPLPHPGGCSLSPKSRGRSGKDGMGRNAGCAVFWGASLVTARARRFGAPKFAVPPQPAAPAPAAAGEGGGIPRGGLGSIGGVGVRAGCVLRVSVLRGFWGA